MAAIDKTYLHSWNEYKQLKDWVESVGNVTDDYGNRFNPKEWLFTCSKKDFDKLEKKNDKWGIPVWNTPTAFDIWLIRNCPLDFIHDTLKDQYGGGWSKCAFTGHNDDDMYWQIKNRTSIYDSYKRNGLGKDFRFTVDYSVNERFRDDGMWWWIEIRYWDNNQTYWWYSEDLDTWMDKSSGDVYGDFSSISSCCTKKYGHMSSGRIRRILSKWNLPEGTKVWFQGTWRRYVMKEFTVTVKRKRK